MRRWPWQNEYGETSPGWALTFIAGAIVTVGLLVQWLNDMHMYGYGVFAR
jgi:hypothetical protein